MHVKASFCVSKTRNSKDSKQKKNIAWFWRSLSLPFLFLLNFVRLWRSDHIIAVLYETISQIDTNIMVRLELNFS